MRILSRYETVHDLARASYDEFFPYYQGMGYYSRARNLLATAKIVSEEYKWIFPREKSLLNKLPGVWEYTSSAILAFGYWEPYLAWDTNLEKVFARYYHGSRLDRLSDEEKVEIEKDFREFIATISASWKLMKTKNGETEGWKLSEEDENSNLMSEASEFFHPSGAFGTFQSWKVHIMNSENDIRNINNALMDFAATIDLKNPSNIDWESYPIRSGKFYETKWSLEPIEMKKSQSFPTPDATVVVVLHKDHKVYYSDSRASVIPAHAGIQHEIKDHIQWLDSGTSMQWQEQILPHLLSLITHHSYLPFILPPSLIRDTRRYVQDYFREKHGLELSVRPAHKKWFSHDGKPYIAVNAQIQTGVYNFDEFSKREAQEILKNMKL
jgi:adenine-specific DNA glycosylase